MSQFGGIGAKACVVSNPRNESVWRGQCKSLCGEQPKESVGLEESCKSLSGEQPKE